MSRIQHVFGKALVGAALALSVALPLGAAAKGMPTDVIYNFTGGPEGSNPQAGLIRDTAGNFYGTTLQGGHVGGNCAFGCGAVFKLSPLGTVTALYTFSGGSDGSNSIGKLVADAAGNLYGTAEGGAHGQGVVFKLTPGGVETVLYSFAGPLQDGEAPRCGLVMDGAGNLYGTTLYGGPSEDGTVFKLAPDGTETVLHSFTGGADGFDPTGDLVMDKSGALYGTTYSDGPSTIFKIAPNGDYSVLHTFKVGGAGGDHVYAGVIIDKHGALYGTTTPNGSGAPVVFKIMPNGKETVLHTFTGLDGAGSQASLIMDKQGNLFGTSERGGAFNLGTVFKISPDGTATVLHSFAYKHDDPPDGSFAAGSLLLYMNKLYGTTQYGGPGRGKFCLKGCGTVFEVKKGK